MEKTVDIKSVSWADDVWQVNAHVKIGSGDNVNNYSGSYSVNGPETMSVDELAVDILARF